MARLQRWQSLSKGSGFDSLRQNEEDPCPAGGCQWFGVEEARQRGFKGGAAVGVAAAVDVQTAEAGSDEPLQHIGRRQRRYHLLPLVRFAALDGAVAPAQPG